VPYWVRLDRTGNTFSAYDSADGIHWNPMGSVTIPMASTVYAGLAVCAFNNGALNDSTFDNVYLSWGSMPPAGGPAAPTDLSASAVPGTREIDLSWTNNAAGATSVLVERSTDGVNWTQVAVLAPGATSRADTDPALQPSTHYWYRVRAEDGTGFSDYSNVFDLWSSSF
jgi:hypothetical protein